MKNLTIVLSLFFGVQLAHAGEIAFLKNDTLYVVKDVATQKAESIKSGVTDFKVNGDTVAYRTGSTLLAYRNGANFEMGAETKSGVTDYKVSGDTIAFLKGSKLYLVQSDGSAKLVRDAVLKYYLSGSDVAFMVSNKLYVVTNFQKGEFKLAADGVRLSLDAEPLTTNNNVNTDGETHH